MPSKKTDRLVIVRDTREKRGFDFKRFKDVLVVNAKLDTGDYSLPWLQTGPASISIERKSLDDLVGCCVSGKSGSRERFERELARSREISRFMVVVEAGMQDVWLHKYVSRVPPKSVLASLNAWFCRFGVPFVFAGTRRGAEWLIHDVLSKYAAHAREYVEAMESGTSPQCPPGQNS